MKCDHSFLQISPSSKDVHKSILTEKIGIDNLKELVRIIKKVEFICGKSKNV